MRSWFLLGFAAFLTSVGVLTSAASPAFAIVKESTSLVCTAYSTINIIRCETDNWLPYQWARQAEYNSYVEPYTLYLQGIGARADAIRDGEKPLLNGAYDRYICAVPGWSSDPTVKACPR